MGAAAPRYAGRQLLPSLLIASETLTHSLLRGREGIGILGDGSSEGWAGAVSIPPSLPASNPPSPPAFNPPGPAGGLDAGLVTHSPE